MADIKLNINAESARQGYQRLMDMLQKLEAKADKLQGNLEKMKIKATEPTQAQRDLQHLSKIEKSVKDIQQATAGIARQPGLKDTFAPLKRSAREAAREVANLNRQSELFARNQAAMAKYFPANVGRSTAYQNMWARQNRSAFMGGGGYSSAGPLAVDRAANTRVANQRAIEAAALSLKDEFLEPFRRDQRTTAGRGIYSGVATGAPDGANQPYFAHYNPAQAHMINYAGRSTTAGGFDPIPWEAQSVESRMMRGQLASPDYMGNQMAMAKHFPTDTGRSAQFKSMAPELEKTDSVMKRVSASMVDNQRIIDSLGDSYNDTAELSKRLTNDTVRQRLGIEKLSDAYNKQNRIARSDLKTTDKQAEAFKQFEKRVDGLRGRLEKLKTTSETLGDSRGIRRYDNAIKSLDKSTEKIWKNGGKGSELYEKQIDSIAKKTTKWEAAQKGVSKRTGLLNTKLGSFSIIMSGIAATMFVWQQVAQGIRTVVGLVTQAERGFAGMRREIAMTGSEAARVQGTATWVSHTGTISSGDAYTKIQELVDAGYDLDTAMSKVQREAIYTAESLEGTLAGAINDVKGGFVDLGDEMAKFLEGPMSGLASFLKNRNEFGKEQELMKLRVATWRMDKGIIPEDPEIRKQLAQMKAQMGIDAFSQTRKEKWHWNQNQYLAPEHSRSRHELSPSELAMRYQGLYGSEADRAETRLEGVLKSTRRKRYSDEYADTKRAITSPAESLTKSVNDGWRSTSIEYMQEMRDMYITETQRVMDEHSRINSAAFQADLSELQEKQAEEKRALIANDRWTLEWAQAHQDERTALEEKYNNKMDTLRRKAQSGTDKIDRAIINAGEKQNREIEKNLQKREWIMKSFNKKLLSITKDNAALYVELEDEVTNAEVNRYLEAGGDPKIARAYQDQRSEDVRVGELERTESMLAGVELAMLRLSRSSQTMSQFIAKDFASATTIMGNSFHEGFTKIIEGDLEGLLDVFANFIDQIANTMMQSATNELAGIAMKAIGGLITSGLGGGGGIEAGTGNVALAAKGGVFDDSPNLSSYSGNIVRTTTPFRFASGAGVMGEAGWEGIFPLAQTPSGDLGVKAVGGDSGTGGGNKPTIQNFYYISAIDSKSFEDRFRGSVTKITTEELNDNNGSLWGALARR